MSILKNIGLKFKCDNEEKDKFVILTESKDQPINYLIKYFKY